MNLRLSDTDSDLLKALAEAQGVSMHEAVLRAIRQSAAHEAHTSQVRLASQEMRVRWADVLRKLGEA